MLGEVKGDSIHLLTHIRWRLQVTRVTLPTGPGTRTTVAWIRVRRWSRIVFQMLGTLWSGRNQLGTGWWWHWATRGRWRLFVQVLARTWMARIVAAARWVVLGKLGVEVCRRVRMGVVHLRRVLAVGWCRVVVGRQVRRWTVHLDRTGVYARWTGRAVTTEGLRSRRQIASWNGIAYINQGMSVEVMCTMCTTDLLTGHRCRCYLQSTRKAVGVMTGPVSQTLVAVW